MTVLISIWSYSVQICGRRLIRPASFPSINFRILPLLPQLLQSQLFLFRQTLNSAELRPEFSILVSGSLL